MIRIRLSEADARHLGDEYRKAHDPAYKTRLLIIRMAARDRPHHQIAADLGITTRTVQRWLNRYLEHGTAGLLLHKAKGAEARIPADMADEVRRWVIEGPQAQGLERANWTHAELAEHLFRMASAPVDQPCSGSAASWASASTGRPIASCGAIPRSRPRLARSWPS